MAVRQQLHETININNPVTKTLMTRWNTAMLDIVNRGTTGDTVIEAVVANRYKFDFYGLLLFLGVNEKYHYPHLLANKYTNPTQFLGNIYTVKLLDNGLLSRYYDAFTR